MQYVCTCVWCIDLEVDKHSATRTAVHTDDVKAGFNRVRLFTKNRVYSRLIRRAEPRERRCWSWRCPRAAITCEVSTLSAISHHLSAHKPRKHRQTRSPQPIPPGTSKLHLPDTRAFYLRIIAHRCVLIPQSAVPHPTPSVNSVNSVDKNPAQLIFVHQIPASTPSWRIRAASIPPMIYDKPA